MTGESTTVFRKDGQRFTLELLGCVLGASTLAAAAVLRAFQPDLIEPAGLVLIFFGGCGLAVMGAWRQAILDERLPPITKTKIKHDHITGWGFIAIALSVSLIVGLASWATSNSLANRDIHAQWGVYVVFGLSIVFVAAAVVPPVNLSGGNSKSILRRVTAIIRPFGLLLSAIDSLLVFAVAGGAGVRQKWLLLRYGLLFGTLVPCGLLGYLLPPPWGLFPLAWGFVVAIAISRRWAWIEDDRDVYMLNREFGTHLRVGFDQDLRDEALLSFMSMFFLVPLALAQAQVWSEHAGAPLFTITLDHKPQLIDWIGYFGAELAKAAPFVDWAEVYSVRGDDHFEPHGVVGEHVVFAMRILVDLVFLAALLQALAIAARNAKQMDLFRTGTLKRLDPFTEPREFRKLLKRGKEDRWVLNEEELSKFPKYDPIRLAELSDPEYAPINLAAIALRRRDGSDDAARFMEQLEERAFQKQKNADSIDEALNAIRVSGVIVAADELDRVRIELNGRRSFNTARETIMHLIARSPQSAERFDAIQSALTGISAHSDGEPPEKVRDAVGPVRRVAVEALRAQVMAGDAAAIRLVDAVAHGDAATLVRQAAREILAQRRGSPPPGVLEPAPA